MLKELREIYVPSRSVSLVIGSRTIDHTVIAASQSAVSGLICRAHNSSAARAEHHRSRWRRVGPVGNSPVDRADLRCSG